MAIKRTENVGEAPGAGGVANSTSNRKTSTEKQTAVIYDMLSEGPVEGLVDGAASIFLDGTAVMEGGNNKSFGAKHSTNVTYTASSGVIVDNNSSLFSGKDLSEGTYYIKIHKAGKSGTVSTTAGRTLITASSNLFTNADSIATGGRRAIHIPGAGPGGSDFVGTIAAFKSATQVYLHTPPRTTVNNVTAHVDLVAILGSIQSSAQATLSSTGQGINATNVSAFVHTPTQLTTSTPKYNFQNTAVAFRPGTRDQSYLKPPAGLGSSAIVYNASSEIAQTDLSSLSGIGSSPNDDSGWNNTPEPTASRTANRVTASQMGVTNPGEVDQIGISINFPNGIFAHKAKSGKEGSTNAEFLIDFDYSTDGSTFTTVRVFGVSDSSLSARGTKLTRPNTNNYGTGTVRKLTRTPFTHTFSFDVEKYQPFVDYRVNIQKVTPAQAEHGSFAHTAPSQLQAIQNIIEDKLSYPYTAYGAVIVDAQNFSSLPVRGYDLKGLKVKVPTNYFPREENGRATAEYTRHVTSGIAQSSAQDWDGNFRGDLNTFTTGENTKLVWTDNPVWILLDIMTNDRYGLGKFIDPNDDFSLIDKFQLYQIAQYCDELVPDGKGGVEPRFTCNMYIKELAEAQRHISDLISIFRGMLVYFNGKIAPQVNSKKSPIYTFTKANVIEGAFSYQSSSSRFRSNQIRVTWNNPESFFRQDVEVVEDIENILETNRINPTEVVALGCTSQGQAIRHGKWILLTEKMATEVVTFSTGLNAAHLKPGDLIEIQDSDIYTTQSAGRVDSNASSSTTVVRLDRAVNLSASGTNFDLNLIYPTGGGYLNEDSAIIGGTTFERGDLLTSITSQTAAANAEDDAGNKIQILWSEYSRIETKPIQSYSANVITVSSAFSSAPNAEVMWSITATTQATGKTVASAPKSFQIVTIQEDSNEKTYSIAATAYSDNLFDLVERGYVIEEIPEIRKPPTRTDIIPVVTTLGLSAVPSGQETTSEDIDIESTGVDILVGWSPPQSTVAGSDKKYEFIAGYEIMILGLEDEEGRGVRKTVTLGPDSTGHRIKNVTPGVLYTVFVRILTTNGFYSAYVKDEIEVVGSKLTLNPGAKISGILKGGFINQTVTINDSSGLLAIGNSSYQFDSPDGITYNNTSTNTSTYQQSFAGMGASAVAYLLFDSSVAATGDRFKAVQFVENTTAVSANGDTLGIKYWKEVGASNDGLTAASGTASMAVNTNLITGSSTSFTTDFEVGDRVFLSSGTSLFMGTINAISSDTSMRVNTNTTRAYSGVAVKKQSFIPSSDAILAKVSTTGSTVYSLEEIYVVSKGIVGGDGQSNAIVYAYQRSATALSSNPGAVTVSLTGTTSGTITTGSLANGWSKTIPSGTNPLYICAATAAGTGSTDTIAANEWSSPVILAESGEDGAAGINSATVFLYQNNNTGNAPSNLPSGNVTYTFATSSLGSFATNANGWSTTNPGVTNSNRYLWVTQATAAANTAADVIADSEWAAIKLLAQKGDDGVSGLKQVQGYLYYEKTSNTGVAPSAPGSTTYTFSTGDIDGGSGATEVLALADTSATNKWTNSPRTQDVGSTSSFWTVRYTGGQSSASDSTCTVTYSAVVKQTAFTGVVTFSGGTFAEDGSSITTIDGANIDTGTITANKLALSGTGKLTIAAIENDSGFQNASDVNTAAKTDGSVGGLTLTSTNIHLGTGTFNNANTGFFVDSSGNFSLKDKLSFDGTNLSINGGGTFSGALSAATGTFSGSLVVGGSSTSVSTVVSGAASGATANQDSTSTIRSVGAATSGTIAAWTISATKISNSKIEIDNTEERILIKDS